MIKALGFYHPFGAPWKAGVSMPHAVLWVSNFAVSKVCEPGLKLSSAAGGHYGKGPPY